MTNERVAPPQGPIFGFWWKCSNLSIVSPLHCHGQPPAFFNMQQSDMNFRLPRFLNSCVRFLLFWQKTLAVISLAIALCCPPAYFLSYRLTRMSASAISRTKERPQLVAKSLFSNDDQNRELLNCGVKLLTSWAKSDQVAKDLLILGISSRPDNPNDNGGDILIVEWKKSRYLVSESNPLAMHFDFRSGWGVALPDQQIHKRLQPKTMSKGSAISLIDFKQKEPAKGEKAIQKIACESTMTGPSKKADDAIALWRKTDPIWRGVDRFHLYCYPTSKRQVRLRFLPLKQPSIAQSPYFLRWRIGQVLTLEKGRWEHLPLGPQTRGKSLARLDEIGLKELRVQLWDRWGLSNDSITCPLQDDRLDAKCLQSLKLIAARSRDRFALQVGEKTIPIVLGSCLHLENGQWRPVESAQCQDGESALIAPIDFDALPGELIVFYALFKKGGAWRVKGELFSRGRALSEKIELSQEMPAVKAAKSIAQTPKKQKREKT